ncbi:MAG: site-2 protease family protein [Planctomycetota bacterium]
MDTLLAYFSVPLFILGFGFLVFVHELGHFLAAKAVGVRTQQFAVGFGHAIVAWRKGIGVRIGSTNAEYHRRAVASMPAEQQSAEELSESDIAKAADALGLGETEYRLNWIPLGGYVKMLGQEDIDPTKRSEDPRAYNNKSVGARVIVISAGVVMNLIIAAIFFVAAFAGGVMFPPAVVGGVIPGSPAATTYAEGHAGDPAYLGLREGDRVVEADGDVVRDLTGVKISAALGRSGGTVRYVVQRPALTADEAPQELTFDIEPAFLRGEPLQSIGVLPPQTTRVGGVMEGSAAARAGVEPGMTVVSVDGEAVGSYAEYAWRVKRAAGHDVVVVYRGDEGAEVSVTTRAAPLMSRADADARASLLGWSPVTELGVPETEETPAKAAGVQNGDLVAEVNGEAWPASTQLLRAIRAADAPIELVVWRDGERVTLPPIQKQMNGLIGVSVSAATDTLRIAAAMPDTPAASVNLPAGSVLRSIDGEPIGDWAEFQRALQARVANAEDGDVSIAIEAELALPGSPSETHEVSLSASAVEAVASSSWAASGAGVLFETSVEPILASGPIEGMALGVEYTIRFIQQTYMTLLRLTQGSVPADQMRGPLGIVDVGAQATQDGWTKALYLLALISVNLAVLNFLPIPITDGGHMIFLAIEKITGKPPSEAVIVWATYGGLALLATVFLFVTFNDIMRLIGIIS